jgi:4-hydroxy-tetrahydrodipicolinate synthase
MKRGCYTALITPFKDNSIDYEGLEKFISFQYENGILGVLAVGTTGESPVFSWDEHKKIIESTASFAKNKLFCIAGVGSNCTSESLKGGKYAVKVGMDALLLVDPYYNGPSSIEIRREYIKPIAKAFPETDIIPYIIPGRTGTQLFPEDLAILYEKYSNVKTVKEATGSLDNMRRTRACCGKNFSIFSGDDSLTYEMMTDPLIKASGVISVISNIAPKAVSDMVKFIKSDIEKAKKLASDLSPLFNIVTVKTTEKTPYGDVLCKAKNPLPIKTIMTILGLPSGGCIRPLGKMTKQGINIVINALKETHAKNPDILKPAGEFFNIDIEERINDLKFTEGLYYETY